MVTMLTNLLDTSATTDIAVVPEAAPIACQELDMSQLDGYSAAGGESGSSRKGYNRDRFKSSHESAVGPDGAWSKTDTQSESISTFTEDTWAVWS
jgi:hypothetical protein